MSIAIKSGAPLPTDEDDKSLYDVVPVGDIEKLPDTPFADYRRRFGAFFLSLSARSYSESYVAIDWPRD